MCFFSIERKRWWYTVWNEQVNWSYQIIIREEKKNITGMLCFTLHFFLSSSFFYQLSHTTYSRYSFHINDRMNYGNDQWREWNNNNNKISPTGRNVPKRFFFLKKRVLNKQASAHKGERENTPPPRWNIN